MFSSGWILLSVGAGPDGFARFWTQFWVAAVSSGCILLIVGAGPDGFDRFLDAFLGRSDQLGLYSSVFFWVVAISSG